jgi:hypothetical protein
MSDVQIAVIDQQDTQIVLAVPGVQGATGSSIPSGGTTDQVLRKNSSTNYDAGWTQVTSAMIADGAIVNADVNNGAAIAGTKISPDFGGQAVTTTGQVNAARVNVTANTAPTNGIYLPSANNVAISTAGSGRLFVDASGNVGVNTASPSYQLDINGQTRIAANSTSAQLRLERTGTSAGHSWLGAQSDALLMVLDSSFAEKLRITSAGLVGVGTSSVTGTNTRLEVSNDSAEIKVSSTSAFNVNFRGFRIGITGDSVDYSGIRFQPTSGELRTEAGFATWGGFQTFYTNGLERLRITSAGLVGIGTTSPDYALDVSGQIRAAANATLAQLRLERTGSNAGHSWLGAQSDALLAVLDSSFAEKMRIDSSGRLLVGTSSETVSSTKLQVGSISGTSNNVLLGNNGTESLVVYFVQTGLTTKSISCTTNDRINVFSNHDTSTGVYLTAGGTSWTSTSDERLKENLEPITDGLAKVSNLRCVVGNYINDPAKKRMPFLIAQDVGQVLPEAVDSTDPGELGLSYTGLIPLLVAALKESKERIEQLEAAVTALQQS